MNHEQDNLHERDKTLDETIRRAVGRESATFNAAGWMARHREEVAMLESRKSTAPRSTGVSPVSRMGVPPMQTLPEDKTFAPRQDQHGRDARATKQLWRTLMNARIIKIAASAAAVVTLAVTAILWTTGNSTIAMAAVLEQLKSKSYEFTLNIREVGEEYEDDPLEVVRGMVLEPGKIRLEQNHGRGPLISIYDRDAKTHLLLFVNFKTGYRFDKEEDVYGFSEEQDFFGFLLSPDNSIYDLWNLQAGTETKLDPKEIDGQTVQGFRVTRETDAHTETITVWADATTAAPVQVTVTLHPKEPDIDGAEHALELTLRDFKVLHNPDPALFSTEVPEGYTLANQLTLEQLAATDATGAPNTPADKDTSAEAEKILSAMKLWLDGDKQQAVETLAAVDWDGDIRFDRKHYVFTLTEREGVSLVSEDREKVLDEIGPQLSKWREIARDGLLPHAAQARAAGNDAQAEQYLNTADRLGHYLNRNKDMALITRLVGMSIQRQALNALSPLYESQGDDAKMQDVKRKLQDIEEQQNEIKGIAAGGAGAEAMATQRGAPIEAEKVLSAMELWRRGDKQLAIETLTVVDWNAKFRFNRDHYMFTMTESQYVSLVTDDQTTVMGEILSRGSDCGNIARELVDRARKAREAGNNDEAANYLNTAVGLGQLLNDKNKMVVVQQAGILVEYLALKEFSSLHEAQGDTDKLQAVQRRMKELEQSEHVKKRPAEGEQ